MRVIIALFIVLLTSMQAQAIQEVTIQQKEQNKPKPKSILLKGKSLFQESRIKKTVNKGILKEISLHGGYQGLFNSVITNEDSKSDLNYTFLVGDVQLQTIFKDDSKFILQVNTLRDIKKVDNKIYNKISDVYYQTATIRNHNIRIGQSRIPTGVEGGQSQYTLLLANRAMLSRTFGNTRPFGIRAKADWGILNYDLGVYDSGRLLNNTFKGAEFTGWINVKPLHNRHLGELVIGSGVDAGSRESDFCVLGNYISYKKDKLFINAEYAFANGYNGNKMSDNKAQGFYTTLAYNLTPKLQFVGRYDYFDNDMKISSNSKQEYTLGINHYISKQRVKNVLNYVYTNNSNAPDGNKIILMTQILL